MAGEKSHSINKMPEARSDKSKQPVAGNYALLVLATIAFITASGGSGFRVLLSYHREAILDGQVWRILTAPIVHLNWSHTFLNIGTLLIIWFFFGRAFNNRTWVYIILGCTLAVSICLLVFNPQVNWYVGLSGILYGFLVAGAIAQRHTHKWITILVVLLMCVKLVREQMFGPLPWSTEAAGGRILVDTHLYGSVSGLLLGWFFSRKSREAT